MYTRLSGFEGWLREQLPSAVFYTKSVTAATMLPQTPSPTPSSTPTATPSATATATPAPAPVLVPSPDDTPAPTRAGGPEDLPQTIYAINCGGEASGDWSADAYFSPDSLSFGRPPGDQPVLNRLRWATQGPLNYTLALPGPDGKYRLRLSWVELYFPNAGSRLMRVSVAVDGGAPMVALAELDVVEAAGGSARETYLVYPPVGSLPLAADKSVQVILDPIKNHPFLTSLRLQTDVPMMDRWTKGINSGSSNMVNSTSSGDGRSYDADSGYSVGSSIWLRGADLPPQLQALRYAGGGRPLAYTIPVPYAGRFRVTLTFTELYYRAAGQRMMDIYLGADAEAVVGESNSNNTGLTRVASSVDTYVEAGNEGDKPVSMTFPADGSTISATESLTVKMLSIKGDPIISTLWVEGMVTLP